MNKPYDKVVIVHMYYILNAYIIYKTYILNLHDFIQNKKKSHLKRWQI